MQRMTVTDYSIAVDAPKATGASKNSGALTIAVIADLHDGDWGEIRESLILRKPDVIAIPGDLVSTELTANCIAFLSSCASIAPTYYSFGNHENRLKADDIAKIRKTGAIPLDDDFVQVGNITIGGLSSGYRFRRVHPGGKGAAGRYSSSPEPDLSWLKMFSELPGFKVLLCHHSEYYSTYIKQTDIDVVLTGHAHGGQIRFGNQGLFAPNQGFFPKWTSGVHDNRLVISRGLANTAGWIPRLGNPPELVYVKIAD